MLSIFAVVAALRVLLEHDLVQALARARILEAFLGALGARPVRLDGPPLKKRNRCKAANRATVPITSWKIAFRKEFGIGCM